MWTCPQFYVSACKQAHTRTPRHDGLSVARHATNFACALARMCTAPHAAKSTPKHIHPARISKCAPARLSTRAHASLSHNPTSQQEGMRT